MWWPISGRAGRLQHQGATATGRPSESTTCPACPYYAGPGRGRFCTEAEPRAAGYPAGDREVEANQAREFILGRQLSLGYLLLQNYEFSSPCSMALSTRRSFEARRCHSSLLERHQDGRGSLSG